MAQTIAAQRPAIGQQPRCRLLSRRRCGQQRGNKVVVGVGFISKTLSIGQYGDKPRLRTFNQVREDQLQAACEGDAGDRCPGHGVFERGVELTADRLPEPDTVPLITRRRGGEVAIAVRCVGNLLRQALAIVRKAAAGEDYGIGLNLAWRFE